MKGSANNQGTFHFPFALILPQFRPLSFCFVLKWSFFCKGLLIVLLVVDRLGRKKSMALCFFIFCLFVLPLYSCLERLPLTIVIFIARAFISAGFQVAYVYTPEVFPTENRALAMGTCSAMARVGSLITPFVSQLLLSVSVHFTLSLNCGIALLAGLACLMLPIETLGRDLQEASPGNEAATQATATTNHSTFS